MPAGSLERPMAVRQPMTGRRPARRAGLRWALLAALLPGCATPKDCERPDVSAKLTARTGFGLGQPPPCDGQIVWPNGACLSDGLGEDEAVLIALWNNALFQ